MLCLLKYEEVSPVDDSMFVQKLKRQRHLRCVEPGSRLVELTRPLYLEHQVATVHKVHDKEQSVVCLEAGVQSCEERVLSCQRQYSLLCHRTVHVVVLDDYVLL